MIGCSKDDLRGALDKAKTQTEAMTKRAGESVTAAAETVLPESGHIDLRWAQPDHPLASVQPRRASIEVIAIGPGRPQVVHITNMDRPVDQAGYPRVLLVGSTPHRSMDQLAGTTMKCQLYVQAGESQVAISAAGQTSQVSFGGINTKDQTISATLSLSRLVDADGQEVVISGGDVVARIRS